MVWLSTLEEPPPADGQLVTRQRIAQSLVDPLSELRFPESIELSLHAGERVPARPTYTIDWELQGKMEKLLRQYRPDYAALVAIDPTTGRVLSLVSYSNKEHRLGNLALRSSYPAASLFKIVTASAAIDSQKAKPNTVIPFNGGYHTLYRRNVTSLQKNRWMREMTVKEAFAKSVNTVFAKMGLFLLDPRDLRQYAKRFRFNEALASDIPTHSGRFVIPGEDPWAIAEIASGYNRWITLSPLQGAMMAAAIANDGVIMEPYLVDKLTTSDGGALYEAQPFPATYALSAASAADVRSLMRETVRSGTSRKTFRTLMQKKAFQNLEVGGKTGSLTGFDPRGKYDWFVGYGLWDGHTPIAISALTINEETWKVKSSFLARSYFEYFYGRLKEQIAKQGEAKETSQ